MNDNRNSLKLVEEDKEQKMKKLLRKVLSSVLVMAMLVCFCGMDVRAAEIDDVEELEFTITELTRDSDISLCAPNFMNASITVGRTSEGMLVNISCLMSEDVDVVGIKDIEIRHKVGILWPVVASSTGGELKNTSGVNFRSVYRDAIVGDTYKITCVFYADYNGSRHELKNDSGAFTFNFPISNPTAITFTATY